MKVAIDKNCVNKIKDFNEFEYIYIFEDEDIDYLLGLKIHCIRKGYIDSVDINLTNYSLYCIKKANIEDEDWRELPKVINHKYAIIVPNYNNDRGDYKGKTYLQNCIESVLNQTYKNFELIIVDDMSTDTSVETVEKYVDKRIHLLKNTRKRYNGGSRNVGIEYAKSTDADYICFLDSDDWWINDTVLEHINQRIYDNEMMILGCKMIFPNSRDIDVWNRFDTYEDIYFSINKVWCTAWSRVIRIDKIVYFCEDTLMEDRVWSYKQADNINFENVTHINEIVYVWNRLNTTNSVSMIRGNFWNASAYCHIGHQLQFLENMKHIEFKNKLEHRIKSCIDKVNNNKFEQY